MDLKVGQVDGHDSIFLNTDKELLERALQIVPDLMEVTIASDDKFIATPQEKQEIHDKFDCDVSDMEYSVLLVCEASNVPCLLLKAVSDGLAGGAKQF